MKSLSIFCSFLSVFTLLHAELLTDGTFQEGLKHWSVFTRPGDTQKTPFTPNPDGGLNVSFGKGQRPPAGRESHLLFQNVRLKKRSVYLFKLRATTTGWVNFSIRYTQTVPRNSTPDYSRDFHMTKRDESFSHIFAYDGTEYPEGGTFQLETGRNWNVSVNLQEISLKELDYRKMPPPPFQDRWIVFPYALPPVDPGKIPATLTDAAGKAVTPVSCVARKFRNQPTKVLTVPGKEFSTRSPAMLYQEIESPVDQELLIGTAADYWFTFYCNGKQVYTTLPGGNRTSNYSPSNHPFLLPLRKGKNVIAIQLLAGTWGWRFFYGTPEPPRPEIIFREGKEWQHMPMKQIVIAENSALDLSALNHTPAGKYGRVVAGKNGILRFENGDATPLRFQGTHPSFSWRYPWLHGSREEFDRNVGRWAEAVRRQGYNAIRLSAFDEWGMRKSKKVLEIPAESMDRLDKMVAELKKQGIYIEFPLMFSSLFRKPHEKVNTSLSKLMMYLGHPRERDAFRTITGEIMNHVNPYTNAAWKDEPTIAIWECFNEQYYGFILIPADFEKKYPEEAAFFRKRWSEFLQKKYAGKPDSALPEALRGGKLAHPPLPFQIRSLRQDYNEFCYECIRETHRFYLTTCRSFGYRGLVANNPTSSLFYSRAIWTELPMVDSHNYYAHPSNLLNRGSKCISDSSVAEQTPAFRGLNNQRLYGFPMWVGEYNHCFWNPYQHELPLAFTAYAALNGYSGLMIHSDTVELERPYNLIRNFEVSDSPVARAGEFLAAMLFRRGDVKTSPHRVVLAIPANYQKGIPGEQSKLALLTGFATAHPGLPRFAEIPEPDAPHLMLTPSGKPMQVTMHRLYAKYTDAADSNFSWPKILQELKQRKILPHDNISDPARGVFQSDTGEITLRAKEKLIKVVTEKTEAVSLTAHTKERLGILEVKDSSVDALIGLTAIDNVPLRNSRRMVLIFSTQMANNGMHLEGDRETLVNIGETRGLMQTGRVSLSAELSGRKYLCYPLNINGTRRTPIPVPVNNGRLELTLDTSELPEGPTPFFELVAQ